LNVFAREAFAARMPYNGGVPDSTTSRKLGFAAALLVATVLLSRVLGFLRDAIIAAIFGANGATDAFYAAFTIPDILNYLVAGGTLAITFIPIYTRHLTAGSEAEGNRVFSIIATAMGILLVVSIVALELATPAIAHAYLHKMRPENLETAISLTRILLPAQLFFYVGGLAAATLYSRHRFVAAAIAPLIYNLGTILGAAFLGRRMGVAGMAWGTISGCIVGVFGLQVIAAGRAGLRYSPSLRLGHPEFKEWVLLTLPLMIGVQLVMADDWFIRYFAAGDAGAISCLNYARKLVQVPVAVAGQAVGQASMPFFARLFAEGKKRELGELVTKSARASAAVAALAACAMIALAVPAVDILFRRGAFQAAQVLPTARYVSIFAIAIPLWAIQGLLARAFYATGDTITPMAAGTAVTIASLPIYWAAQHSLGVNGLVIASDVGIFLHTASLFLLLPRRLDSCNRRDIVVGTARAFGLGLVAGAAAYTAARFLPRGHAGDHAYALLQLGVGGLVFAIVAVPLARPLGAVDVAVFFERLGDKLLRRFKR
jgi:putative peptidoglycan lipid II flippase